MPDTGYAFVREAREHLIRLRESLLEGETDEIMDQSRRAIAESLALMALIDRFHFGSPPGPERPTGAQSGA
jgi:hypothetical protein